MKEIFFNMNIVKNLYYKIASAAFIWEIVNVSGHNHYDLIPFKQNCLYKYNYLIIPCSLKDIHSYS